MTSERDDPSLRSDAAFRKKTDRWATRHVPMGGRVGPLAPNYVNLAALFAQDHWPQDLAVCGGWAHVFYCDGPPPSRFLPRLGPLAVRERPLSLS